MNTNKILNKIGTKGSNLNAIISIIVILLIFFFAASIFMPNQSIWVDETTQLSGLTLNPIEVSRWLSGTEANQFNVPADRMPPLSYWIGWSWSKLFGLTETSMRLFGILCVAISSIFIFMSARTAFGLTGAIIAGLIFSLSPNIINFAVEIRAYPLFLLFASGAFFSLIQIIVKENKKYFWHTLLTIFCIAAIYTHFYGLIMSGSLLFGLLVVSILNKRSVLPAIIAGIIILISFTGVIPFILSSINVTGSSSIEGNKLYNLIRLLYRLFAHASIQVNLFITFLCLLSVATLIVLSFWPKKSGNYSHYAVMLTLGLGYIIILISSLIISGFKSSEISYNIWMIPGICLLIASVVQIQNYRLRAIGLIAGIIFVITTFYSTIQFLGNASKFAHTPYNRIKPIIQQFDQNNLGIIFDSNSTVWAFIYFPIIYDFGKNTNLYLAIKNNENSIILKKFPDLKEQLFINDIKYSHIIIIKTELQSSQMIIQQIKTGEKPLIPNQLKDYFIKTKNYNLLEEKLFVTMTSSDISVFNRK